ncbi:MAG: CDP-diacylglycerol--serine O-phosphatidyltransferase [Gammaproteobacteria bacterium]|nr:CDP-diacylglycerol--serine O-phosphatidyltransferase [Gammaproteobacteria bacterium]
MHQDAHRKGPGGIFLLPNLFTTGVLFTGFYAIVAAMHERFEAGAISIFVAMVFDNLDGRIARMTNTQSAFGAEYDSLADMISFGLAPAIVMYQWQLAQLGKAGWLIAFIYTAAVALRLARFNTQLGVADKRFFQGLPSPAGAAITAGFVWFCEHAEFDSGFSVTAIVPILALATALLMVSNTRYYSFKDFDLKNRIPFVAVLAMVGGWVIVTLDPSSVLFLLAIAYGLSGPLLTLIQVRRRRAARHRGGVEPQA